MIWKPHTVCRACSCTDLLPVLDLGEQPLANAFTRDGTPAPRAPSTVLHCPNCTLIQLSVVVDPEVLYRPGYAYVQQSRSASMQVHFEALTDTIVLAGGHGPVLEIGSNDGSFLAHLGERGFDDRYGMDPAASGTEPFTRTPFNEESAKSYAAVLGPANLVVARHVFAHLDDWKGFIRALDLTTTLDALVVIEVPDAQAAFNNLDWPYFYHEHLSLVTRHSLNALLRDTGWAVFDVKRFPIHGGSVAYFLRRGIPPETPFLVEGRMGAEDWKRFSAGTYSHIESLSRFVRTLSESGAVIAGYGAPARASVIASACKFTKREISFITDWTPGKGGCLLPGTDIPVIRPIDVAVEADYQLLFAYTYSDEILARERGTKFILPFPEPRIV